MQAAASVLWACLAGVVQLSAANTEDGRHAESWRHVSVEPLWFKPTVTQTPRSLGLILCGAACMRHDWCQLWCHEAPRGCLLTSLTASAAYTPAQPEGALSCYTSRPPPDLAVGAAITSSPPYNVDKKLKENLVDGIYSSNILDCATATTDNGVHAWFLLDLGAAHPISEVLLVAQPNDKVANYFRDIEVRVGSTPRVGDFSTYQLLGTFTSIAEPEQTVVLRPAAPVTGRYVSIQRTTDGILQIAHIEVR